VNSETRQASHNLAEVRNKRANGQILTKKDQGPCLPATKGRKRMMEGRPKKRVRLIRDEYRWAETKKKKKKGYPIP